MHQIGIFQGRLSPILDGRIQFFPVQSWQSEFGLARKLGFDFIEWVFETNNQTQNPLTDKFLKEELAEIKQNTGVCVRGICADIFMDSQLLSNKGYSNTESLIISAGEIDAKFIEIPLLKASRIDNAREVLKLVDFCEQFTDCCHENNIKIYFETDLPPADVKSLLNALDMNHIGINYDTGNSAYWKFNCIEELETYGHKLGNIHVKDCTPSDYSVPLGRGNFKFDPFFEELNKLNYTGDFVLQTERDSVNYLIAAKEYLNFTKKYIKRLSNGS